ncbi:hypothetical protein HPB48_011240 [Haemaphysalis longicornis]|uniref:Uncharacterized protein n=1 Tax=Haemaphysalis longicornis TaxID=44386 RepID=A0A9J6GGL6_HAELO|nr:hypothetical protein HPB48_011240 [Haemaphysalis longicornis]
MPRSQQLESDETLPGLRSWKTSVKMMKDTESIQNLKQFASPQTMESFCVTLMGLGLQQRQLSGFLRAVRLCLHEASTLLVNDGHHLTIE